MFNFDLKESLEVAARVLSQRQNTCTTFFYTIRLISLQILLILRRGAKAFNQSFLEGELGLA